MRILRKVFMAALIVALSVGLYTIAAADEGAVSIQLNGKLIEFPSGVEPYYSDELWRVFVPANDVFTQMGAQVEYDADTRTITLTRGDVKVAFPQDGTTVEITYGDDDAITMESDVKPVTIDSRVLVPLRFVANTLGCKVGWDQAASTAIIIDPVSYLAGRTETFDILTNLSEIEGESAGNQAIATEISGAIAGQGLNADLSLELNGVSSQTAMDSTLSGKLTIPPEVAESIIPGLSLSEIPLQADIIFNIETGLFAIHSETANMLMGLGADTWITAGDALGAYAGAGNLAAQSGQDELDVSQALKDMLTQQIMALPEPTGVADFEAIGLQVGLMYGLLSDSALTQTEDGYKSEFSYEIEGAVTETALAFTTGEDGKAVGMTMTVAVKAGGETVADVKITLADEELVMEIHGGAEGVTVDLTVKMTVSPTDEQPRAQLPEGAEAVDFAELDLTALV
ncbi:MAG: copper amine oxidase N-terminal domain-containing protein [Oscillospiraceae bacterium]|jgi:hypothetical protein|nr:copper amine oxidase N-terminal domain-containing protein [Oscillospiraceae bacterium]